MKRHRTARRKFHHLQLDVLFVAVAAVALFAQAMRPLPAKTRTSEASASATDTEFAMVLTEIAQEPVFDPYPVAHSARGAAGSAIPIPIPPDLAVVQRTGRFPGPLWTPKAEPPKLPLSVAKPTFPPAPAPFSSPLEPLGPVSGGRSGRNAGAEAFVFRDPGNEFPVVFVDAPRATAAEVPALESEAFILETKLPATARVVRVALPFSTLVDTASAR